MCKEVYECLDLAEVTTRINLVSLARLKLEDREEEVSSLAGFLAFANELFEELNTFEKFKMLKEKQNIEKEVIDELIADVAKEIMNPREWEEGEEVEELAWQVVGEAEEVEEVVEVDQVLEERKGDSP